MERRDKEDNIYARLQKQSLDMLQRLSGECWSDFNEHDPGVTIMDILNYNLLELDYQTGFDFPQYLTPPLQDELEFSQIGLLPGDEIFSPCIVSPHDYEELIETGVEGVKECEVKLLPGNRYRIYIDIEDEEQSARIISEVESLYHRHRNLCETLEAVLCKRIPKRRRFRHSAQVEYVQGNKKTQSRNALTAEPVSVQYDFPDAYGINRQGLVSSASPQRQAQTLQLKGYLLIFDYLLSATRQQLGGLHQSLALSGQIPVPFSPLINAGDLKLLVDEQKLKQTELFRKEEMNSRKSAYLDLLDALYGEDTSFIAKNKQLSPEEVNQRRARLINRLPQLNTDRFRAIDLTDRSLESAPGIKRLMQALWGISNSQQQEITLESLYAHYRLRLIDDDALYDDDSVFSEFSTSDHGYDTESLNEKTEPVPVIPVPSGKKKYKLLRKRLHFFSHNLLLQSMPTYGTNPENYRLRRTGFRDNAILLYKCPSGSKWLNIGFFDNPEILIQTANILWDFLEMLNNRCTAFYVVENLLLQSEKPLESEKPLQQSSSEITADTCNVLHLIFPVWRKSFYEKNNYLKHLQERLPIHIQAWINWLPFEEFYRFEQHYFSWRMAVATDRAEQAKNHAEEIKKLIKTNND